MFHSIRWRLSLSFAAIALLAALALGAVLLAIVQDYYSRQELDYLQNNAKSIGLTLTKFNGSDLPKAAIQLQVENLAFLSQTRVRVLDGNSQLLYDSGTPQRINVSVGVVRQRVTLENPAGDKSTGEFTKIISLGDVFTKTVVTSDNPADAGTPVKDQMFVLFRAMPAAGTPFGFDLGSGMLLSAARSNQVVHVPLTDTNGKTLGSVELSQGPALGRDIVASVARGWVIASAIAVLLAAVAGWLISRRMTAPLVALTGATTRMASGDLSSRAMVTSRDEFGELALSFNEMADQVQGTVAALRHFVSDAAHELHTPLTALRTNLDLASGAAGKEEYLARAQALVVRMETLTNDLLDLSRIEGKQANEPAEAIDLVELVRQRSEFYASQADQAGLEFGLDLPAEPIRIRAETAQVNRVVDNLVDNACKFTPPGGTVSIALRQEDGTARLSVSDTGIGIPAGDLPQLFSRFHRGRNATLYAGSGLGLAIVKAILQPQCGKVSAENTNPGARFTVEWPSGT